MASALTSISDLPIHIESDMGVSLYMKNNI